MMNDAELILNADGSIYHLNLKPHEIAKTVIFVGDPDRVTEVSKYFDTIEYRKSKREFITHTGTLNGKQLTVISTGIGTDNIDIVLTELDALVNFDFTSRTLKEELSSLDIIRIGTSGSIQGNIAMGTILASEYAIGFDTLMQYYKKPELPTELLLQQEVIQFFDELTFKPYVAHASTKLLELLAYDLPKGITMTAPGFYGPQGRNLRSTNMYPNLIRKANQFRFQNRQITNLEMETAGIYALSNMLGHHAISINAILASRVQESFCHNPEEIVDNAIQLVLNRLTAKS